MKDTPKPQISSDARVLATVIHGLLKGAAQTCMNKTYMPRQIEKLIADTDSPQTKATLQELQQKLEIEAHKDLAIADAIRNAITAITPYSDFEP